MTLKFGSLEEKQKMFREYQGNIRAIVDDVIEMAYYMRGAISYDEIMLMSPGERERVGRFIEKRLEQESKSPHPVY